MKLLNIQAELKAPKSQFNSFGKYKYRSQEDILEALKPLLAKYDCTLTISDSIRQIGSIYFVEALARLRDNEDKSVIEVTASAGIDPGKKGMGIEQCFGSASSYARKYALNGLFLIDDTKDADATNTHEDIDEVGQENRDYLLQLLQTSTYDDRIRTQLEYRINGIKTQIAFDDAKLNLQSNQLGIDGAVNPSAKDISRKIKSTLNG